MGSLTPHLFVPHADRPVRAKLRGLAAATRVAPHSHPWAQVAMPDRGAIRLTVDGGSFLVPPSHALWIPPGRVHAVTMLEDADLRTLYLYVPRGRCGPSAFSAMVRRSVGQPAGRFLGKAARTFPT